MTKVLLEVKNPNGAEFFFIDGKRVSNHNYSVEWLELDDTGKLKEPRVLYSGQSRKTTWKVRQD